MAVRYVVIDADGFTSSREADGEPESFKSRDAARKRASELARQNPGQVIRIYESIEECIAQVQPVIFLTTPKA